MSAHRAGKMVKLVEELRRELGDANLLQASVLLAVADQPGTTPLAICERLDAPKSSVSRHILNMSGHRRLRLAPAAGGRIPESPPLIRSEPDPGNLRYKLLYLTEDGRRLVKRLEKLL